MPDGIVTVHVVAVFAAAQLPPHSLNELPKVGVAVKTTVRGAGAGEGRTPIRAGKAGMFSLQSEGQSIPVPVTFPDPATDTVNV